MEKKYLVLLVLFVVIAVLVGLVLAAIVLLNFEYFTAMIKFIFIMSQLIFRYGI